jgi:hypothetical protein
MRKNSHIEVKGYRCLLPSGLDLAKLLTLNPPDFEPDLGLLHYLVHLTIEVAANNGDLMTKDGFVPFNAQILRGKSKEYRPHLTYLVDQGVLDEDRQYVVGKHSRHFRIAEKYLSNRLSEIVITDTKLLKSIDGNSGLNFHDTMQYQNLYRWFDPEKLKIDLEAAEAYIYAQLDKNRDESYYGAYISAYTKILKVRMIAEGAFWFNVDKFGKRLHTNLTNLDKDLKPFVTFEGQHLVSVDVKNSQPFFSLKILEGVKQGRYQSISHTKTPTDTIMIVEEAQTLDFTDVLEYRGEVVGGTLYESLESEMRKEFGDGYFTRPWIYDVSKRRVVRNTFTPRQIVKGVTYQIFFSKNEVVKKEKELFRRLYPAVMNAFENYKGNLHLRYKDRHRRLAKALQRIESGIILDKVVKAISRSRPDLTIYTIHDSIVTTVGNESYVSEVMQRILAENIGYPPTLATEYWCKDRQQAEQHAA